MHHAMFQTEKAPVEQNLRASDVLTFKTREQFTTGYYDEITGRDPGWRRFFKPAQARSAVDTRPNRPPPGPGAPQPQRPPGRIRGGKKTSSPACACGWSELSFSPSSPRSAVMYFFNLGEWAGFLVGLLALAAAWYGGERFIMRQLRALLSSRRNASRKATSPAAPAFTDGKSELGQLARTFDIMAESLQQRAKESEQSEKLLLNRAQQQAVVAAIGQFAMVSQDFNALLNQALQLVSETFEVQLAHVLELQPESGSTCHLPGRRRLECGTRSAGFELSLKRAAAPKAAFVLRSGARGHPGHAPGTSVHLPEPVARSLGRQRRLPRHRHPPTPYGMLGVYTTTARTVHG
jgi:hypothetical protein